MAMWLFLFFVSVVLLAYAAAKGARPACRGGRASRPARTLGPRPVPRSW